MYESLRVASTNCGQASSVLFDILTVQCMYEVSRSKNTLGVASTVQIVLKRQSTIVRTIQAGGGEQ